jgi:hypothetical protein
MKCKDIPDISVLQFLNKNHDVLYNWCFGDENDVSNAMQASTPHKLVLGKMRMLMRRGLVNGCGCGCRSDFKITPKGVLFIKANTQP